ncbi:hypothetical protein DFH29DRAFT_884126 [Suillus ampliporus]|nr:hypothetical protein DFH29DRAFT_884126 [Suillus ampliporus]
MLWQNCLDNSGILQHQHLKTAQLKGSVFQADCDDGTVSSVFTSFYVDHAEPLKALKQYKAKGPWALGELLDGHEFLVIFPMPVIPIANTYGISETIVSFIRQSFPAVRNLRYNQVGTFGHYSSIATILPGAGWYKKYKAEAYPIFFAIPRACSKRVAEPTLRRREALRRVALVF